VTEIWLVRHGQTDWNIEGRWQGHADIPLNSTGLEQARSLAADLADNCGSVFNAIYSSDLLRASQTAQEIGRCLIMQVLTDRRLREISKGVWEGKLVTQVNELADEAIGEARQRQEDPLNSHPPGGESLAELAERLSQVMNEIAGAHPVGPVLVVTHGLALAALLCLANGWPLQDAYDHIPDNARHHVITWKV
jgi:probable phosphoglycerate mutase